MTSKSLFMCGAATLTLSIAMPAMAQDREGTLVDPLVITVERRAESLQDVPVAVTAVDDKMRDNLGVLTIQDMAQYTPGLSYNTTLDRPTIRGIGRQSNFFSLESPVANYFDGIYTSSVQDADRRPMFIERTEILRGPQGALSGRGSIAGAINTISKRPADSFEMEIGGLAGNYSRYGLEATVSAPLLPWLRYRANVGHYRQEDGYFNNVAFPASEGDQPNNRNIYDFLLEGDIGENIDFFLKASFADYDESRRTGASLAPYSGGGSSACNPRAYSGGLVPNAAYGYFLTIPAGCANAGTAVPSGGEVLGGVRTNPVTLDNLRLYNSDMTSRQKLDDHHVYLGEITWDGPGFEARYIGGHQNYEYTQVTDADGTAVTSLLLPNANGTAFRRVDPSGTNLYREQREWFSHEVNVASTHEGPLQWIAGVYQSLEDYNQEPSTQIFRGYAELNTPRNEVTFAVEPVNAVPFRAQYGEMFGDTRSSAVYGQLDWQRSEEWKFTLGLRYNKDEKSIREQTRLIYNNDAGLAMFANGGFPLSLDITPSQAPGFSTAVAGSPAILPGSTIIDPAVEGFPIVGGNYVLPNGGGLVPVGRVAVLAPGVVGLPFTDADGNRVRDLAGEWEAVTGSLGVNFTPNEDTLIYARFARGYRPGGFNGGGFITVTPQVDKETLDSYEVGAKFTLWDRLQLNTAAFFYDYQDIQQPLSTYERCIVPGDFTTCTAVNSFVNLPSAENVGLEVEGTWFATDNLVLSFTYGYLDTKITNGLTALGFEDPLDPSAQLPTAQPLLPINCTTPVAEPAPFGAGCQTRTVDGFTGPFAIDNVTNAVRFTQDLTGNPLQNAPAHKIFLNSAYTFYLPAGDLTLSGTYIWQDEAYSGLFGSELDKTPAYDQVNLRVLWRDADSRYQIIGYVQNVFDEDVSDSFGLTRRLESDPLSPGAISAGGATYYPSYNLAPPRTYGVEVIRRF